MHALARIHSEPCMPQAGARPSAARPPNARPLPAWAWVACGGVALGLADLAFAALYWFLHSGVAPIRIAQSISGWVLGPAAARAGGIPSALAGAALYCAVVAAMVAGYLKLSAWRPAVHARVAFSGAMYGLAMYVLLFRLVLPLAAPANAPTSAMPPPWTIACLAAYAGIGIGCALLARAKAARDG